MIEDDDLFDVTRIDFYQKGCAAFARNACLLLKMAGRPVTPENVLRIVDTAPWSIESLDRGYWKDGYCKECLDVAFRRSSGNRETFFTLEAYFKFHITRLRIESRQMMEAAFIGVLGGIRWEEVTEHPDLEARGHRKVPVSGQLVLVRAEKPEKKRRWWWRWKGGAR